MDAMPAKSCALERCITALEQSQRKAAPPFLQKTQKGWATQDVFPSIERAPPAASHFPARDAASG
jgi:hypothetical protein